MGQIMGQRFPGRCQHQGDAGARVMPWAELWRPSGHVSIMRNADSYYVRLWSFCR